MKPSFAGWDDATLDLAIDRFTHGLDARERAELERRTATADLEDFEYALAAIHLAHLAERKQLDSPPAALVDRLRTLGRDELPPARTAVEQAPAAGLSWAALSGWLTAAALLLAFLWPRGAKLLSPPEAARLRSSMIASAGDLVRVDWTTSEDSAAFGASGDVVWSSERQEGYMLLRGLAANDPTVEQYQLWIFDPTRADWEAKPVDGGVFDVPAGGGEVVVPIDAKLDVRETALFAVTIEVPGGVVVSERERLVLTAAP